MFDLQSLVRENVKRMKPYSSARSEFTGRAEVFLDANENPRAPWWGPLNRYPDPLQRRLKSALAVEKGSREDSIFVGNGSDEAIDLLMRIFCVPGRDAIILCSPTYGMYRTSADLNDVACIEAPLAADFSLRPEEVMRVSTPESKLVFLCSPNNPTGNCLERSAIVELLERFPGVVVVDEAYIDFCPERSVLGLVARHPNLVVLQTFSKAWGLAGIRVGMAFGSPELIDLMNRVKPPYNVDTPSQETALKALSRPSEMRAAAADLVSERERVAAGLGAIGLFERIYPSDANFILAKSADPRGLYEFLLGQGIVVRDRSGVPGCEGCMRITVGLPSENDALIAACSAFLGAKGGAAAGRPVQAPLALPERRARLARQTSETRIELELNLDGTGRAEIRTGLGFFDHMLDQIARHSGVDLEIAVDGDLHVDEHHVVEDTAIALGDAFSRALGDKRGIERYGFLLPMDDCLAQVALDLSGRSWLVWDARFEREKVGDLPTEMFFHFFKSFSDAARCNLNIRAEGQNEHHKIESIFKAFARALKAAISRREGGGIPSTKGVL